MTNLKKVGDSVKGSEYENEEGEKYLLSAVTRCYQGTAKKPVYYLSQWQAGRWAYISGLFKTKQDGVYSFDTRDNFGVRRLSTCILSEGGDSMTLQDGRATKTA